MRKIFYAIAFLLASISLFAQNKKNVVIITFDDMNWNSPGSWGLVQHAPNPTPTLDKLSKECLNFDRAYVPSPVCQVCRQSIQSARYPSNLIPGFGFHPIGRNCETFGEILHNNGYFNAIIGAKHGHHQPASKYFWDFVSDKNIKDFKPSGTILEGRYDEICITNNRDKNFFYDQVKKAVAQAKQENKPVFLLINITDPHRPFYTGRADEATLIPPSRVYSAEEVRIHAFLPDLPNVRRDVADYYSCVRRADDCTAKIIEALKEDNIYEDALLVFFSDHGMAFPFAKEHTTNNGEKTPLMIRIPQKTAKNSRTNALINLIDITPTLLDELDLPAFKDADGKSFAGIYDKSKNFEQSKYIFGEYDASWNDIMYPQRSTISTDGFFYIFNPWTTGKHSFRGDHGGTPGFMNNAQHLPNQDIWMKRRLQHYLYNQVEELYNVNEDPDSLYDISKNPKYKEKLAEMRTATLEQMQRINDPLLECFKTYQSTGSLPEEMPHYYHPYLIRQFIKLDGLSESEATSKATQILKARLSIREQFPN